MSHQNKNDRFTSHWDSKKDWNAKNVLQSQQTNVLSGKLEITKPLRNAGNERNEKS